MLGEVYIEDSHGTGSFDFSAATAGGTAAFVLGTISAFLTGALLATEAGGRP